MSKSSCVRGEMAQGGVHLDRQTFSCSICLELLKDPVTTSCGHNYCFRCIKDHWDREDEEGIHNCPQCSKIVTTRSELMRNTTLEALVEQLKETGLQDAPVDHCYAGAEDVACDVCTGRKLSISSQVDVLLPEPQTREEFLRYLHDITLDPNTVHIQLRLSEEDRRATVMRKHQRHPDHPDRFCDCCQVLSRESLTGRCYWEVKVRKGAVRVAVAYKDISRTGEESRFGCNNKSWALFCNTQHYTFRSNNVESPVSGPWSSTVGVFLDHPAGLLSFYNVSDTMTLLHRVQTSFTQPLIAGIGFPFGLSPSFGVANSSAELVKLG